MTIFSKKMLFSIGFTKNALKNREIVVFFIENN